MTIKDIEHFVQASTTIDQRLRILERQKEIVAAKMDQLLTYQSMIERKIEIYTKMQSEVEM